MQISTLDLFGSLAAPGFEPSATFLAFLADMLLLDTVLFDMVFDMILGGSWYFWSLDTVVLVELVLILGGRSWYFERNGGVGVGS